MKFADLQPDKLYVFDSQGDPDCEADFARDYNGKVLRFLQVRNNNIADFLVLAPGNLVGLLHLAEASGMRYIHPYDDTDSTIKRAFKEGLG